MDEGLTRLTESQVTSHTAFLEEDADFGPYRIVGLLGRGGMGEVYEAEHRDLHTRHALKLINPEILDRPDAKERFKREARVMARLRHPNIVHVDDFGELDGRIWLRMDLMDGWSNQAKTFRSLQDLMRDRGALPAPLVRRLIGEILDGLGFAHDAGVVHRDLKPANLLLDDKGNVKITDFGLVSLAGAEWLQTQVQLTVARSMADPDATRLDAGGSSMGTSTQALLGTYAYMSPEQKKGAEVDARSDLYAVGLIGFQLLTGEETPGFEMPSDLVDDLDPAWDQWVREALASRAEWRYADAGTMKASIPGSEKPPVGEDPPSVAPMDQEFSRLEERIAAQSEPPPVPEFDRIEPRELKIGDARNDSQPSASVEARREVKRATASQISDLSDKDLKKAYFASRNINCYAIFVLIVGGLILLFSLALFSFIEEWTLRIYLMMALCCVAYGYFSFNRSEWGRKALLTFNGFSLLSFNPVSILMLFVIGKNKNLFGSDRFTHTRLKTEFKNRHLSAGLPGILTLIIPFIILLIIVGVANA